MSQFLRFQVLGDPVPQGSTKGFFIEKINRVVITHANPSTTKWRERIATEAQAAVLEARWPLHEGPVVVEMEFYFTRPKSLPKYVRHHVKRPDIDKLARACLDGLTDIVFRDDSQVDDLHPRKFYAEEGVQPCLIIEVEAIEEAAPKPRVKKGAAA